MLKVYYFIINLIKENIYYFYNNKFSYNFLKQFNKDKMYYFDDSMFPYSQAHKRMRMHRWAD